MADILIEVDDETYNTFCKAMNLDINFQKIIRLGGYALIRKSYDITDVMKLFKEDQAKEKSNNMDMAVHTIFGKNVVCDVGHLIDVLKQVGFKVEPDNHIKEEKPIFEIRNANWNGSGIGVIYNIKIWANGKVEGIHGTVVNRIPELMLKIKQESSAELSDIVDNLNKNGVFKNINYELIQTIAAKYNMTNSLVYQIVTDYVKNNS